MTISKFQMASSVPSIILLCTKCFDLSYAGVSLPLWLAARTRRRTISAMCSANLNQRSRLPPSHRLPIKWFPRKVPTVRQSQNICKAQSPTIYREQYTSCGWSLRLCWARRPNGNTQSYACVKLYIIYI